MTTLLIIVVALLGIYAISQVLRIFELSASLRGRKVYEVTKQEGKVQAAMMLMFLVAYFIFIIWQVMEWGPLALPVSASEHGVVTDNLLDVTWWIIIPVFIVTHILLFWFGYRYVYDENRRADFFAHSNKLELIWTVVPAITLTILILYGLNTWNDITAPIDEETDHVKVQLYAKQFEWSARYAGQDGQLGNANVRFIEADNMQGMDKSDPAGQDDKIVVREFHLPVNVPVQFTFRSQDVIHSAYMPHFRAQMNCVPGMTTQFKFTPTITTAEMKQITGNDEFEYILLCNKICGAAHYNMQMTIVVESEEDYKLWLAGQKTFGGNEVAVAEEVMEEEPAMDEEMAAEEEMTEENAAEEEAVEAETSEENAH